MILTVSFAVKYKEGSDLISFETHRKTSLYDFEGIGRITAFEVGIPFLTPNVGAIMLPNGKYIELRPGISSGIGWKISAYIVMAYWDLISAPRKIF